jgi:hypothetical protein
LKIEVMKWFYPLNFGLPSRHDAILILSIIEG